MAHEVTAEEGIAQVQAADAAGAADRQATLGEAAPEAEEPLDPDALNALGEMIVSALPRMSRGQIPAESIVIAPVTEPQPVMPADLFTNMLALSIGMQEAVDNGVKAAEPFIFDPLALATTNAGIQEMGGIVSAMGQDEELANALVQPAGPQASPEAPETERTPQDQATELINGNERNRS